MDPRSFGYFVAIPPLVIRPDLRDYPIYNDPKSLSLNGLLKLVNLIIQEVKERSVLAINVSICPVLDHTGPQSEESD